MDNHESKDQSTTLIITSSRTYFLNRINEAFETRKLKASPLAKSYLVDLLEFYIQSQNLFGGPDEESPRISTLAEMLLIASNSDLTKKQELLKRLGDSSLYISGFFGDSLNQKLVDLDYYAEMGGCAYATLSTLRSKEAAILFTELAEGFSDFVEVLTLISQQSRVQTNGDLLRLYSRFLSTGSELAAEQLRERGIFTAAPLRRSSKQ